MEAVPFKPVPEVPDRAEYALRAGFLMKAGEEFELGAGQDLGRILGRGAAIKLRASDQAATEELAKLAEADKPKPKPKRAAVAKGQKPEAAKVAEAVETLVAGKPQEPGAVVASAPANPSLVERTAARIQDGKRR